MKRPQRRLSHSDPRSVPSRIAPVVTVTITIRVIHCVASPGNLSRPSCQPNRPHHLLTISSVSVGGSVSVGQKSALFDWIVSKSITVLVSPLRPVKRESITLFVDTKSCFRVDIKRVIAKIAIAIKMLVRASSSTQPSESTGNPASVSGQGSEPSLAPSPSNQRFSSQPSTSTVKVESGQRSSMS